MRKEFKFDPRTGTYVSAEQSEVRDIDVPKPQEIKSTPSTGKPAEAPKQKSVVPKSPAAVAGGYKVVKMRRTDKPTPVQLVDDNGLPESYLDATNTGVMMFREREDYDICQITDERTGKVLAYIGGYALAFNFNMAELRTMERIEQCLQGLVKLFRHKIMTQTLGEDTAGNQG